VYSEEFGSKGKALSREYEIKQMTREEKEELIRSKKK
jgi:predicted GIY-YIG superfamily endonuclease